MNCKQLISETYREHTRIADVVLVSMYYEHDRIGDVETDQIIDFTVVLIGDAFDPFGGRRRIVDDTVIQFTRRIGQNDRCG